MLARGRRPRRGVLLSPCITFAGGKRCDDSWRTDELHGGDTWGSADGNAPLSPFVPQGAARHPEWRLWPLLSRHNGVNDLRLIFIYCHICLFLHGNWTALLMYLHMCRSTGTAKHSCCVEGIFLRWTHAGIRNVVDLGWHPEGCRFESHKADPWNIATAPLKGDYNCIVCFKWMSMSTFGLVIRHNCLAVWVMEDWTDLIWGK